MKTSTIGLRTDGFVTDSLTIHSGQSRFKLLSATMAEVATVADPVRRSIRY
jgi:hypothetical protein